MKFIKVCFLLVFNMIWSIESTAQLDFEVRIEFQSAQGPKFKGYVLNSDSLVLGGYFWKNSLFKGDYSIYKSVSIPTNQLNALTLYRIKMLIVHNEYFSDVGRGGIFYAETTGHPVIYTIKRNGTDVEAVIYDYKYYDDTDTSKSRYLISELEYLFTELIPKKYKEFGHSSAVYNKYIKP